MSHPSGGRLAELTRAAVVRVAALTGRVDAAALDPPHLPPCSIAPAAACPTGGSTRGGRRHVVTAAERTARAGLTGHTRTDGQHWHSWTATDADPATLVHKIYVSPAVRDIATTLGVILTHAPLLGVPAWKVGADLAGLHRPDKIVLYLASAERADRVAAALALTLGGAAAQGVPFTGQVGVTGIVSRGRDVAGTSWRADVCRQVAESLLASRAWLGRRPAPPRSPTRPHARSPRRGSTCRPASVGRAQAKPPPRHCPRVHPAVVTGTAEGVTWRRRRHRRCRRQGRRTRAEVTCS